MIFDVDFRRLMRFHKGHEAMATLLAHPNDHPYDSGILLADGTGRVTGWLTKEIEETLTYCDFPGEHWIRIRTNNVIERLSREIRRRTRVVSCFPDGNSALMLVCARLRYVADTQWGNKKYMNMKRLEATLEDASIAS